MGYLLKCKAGGYIVPVSVEPVDNNLVLTFPFNRAMLTEVKAMERNPGGGWDPVRKVWVVANSRRNLFALDILVGGDMIARYDADINFTQHVDGFWSHQDRMKAFIDARHRCILAAEMRTGKTRPTLKAFYDSKWAECWWVAPKSALAGLPRELKKFPLPNGKELRTFSYEGFKREVKNTSHVPGFLVFDECQKLKTPTSERSEMAQELSDTMAGAYGGDEFVIGLSGTPAPKDPSDWWNICEIIQPGFILEGDLNRFKRRYGVWEQREGAVGQMYWHLVHWNIDEIDRMYNRLKPLVQVNLKKDCLDLPPIRYEIREFEPSVELMQVARTVLDTETHALTAINKLRQLSDGFMYVKEYDEEKNRTNRHSEYVGSPKEVGLKEELDNHWDTGRLIVYAGFQGSVDIITKIATEKGWWVLQADGRAWQVFKPNSEGASEHGDIDSYSVDFLLGEMDGSVNTRTVSNLVFVAQTDAAGTGLELSASPTTIYYSNSNNGEGRMQSEARAHSNNMDKERGLTVIDFIHLPVDKKIRDSLLNKKELQGISMGELKKAFAREAQ